MAEMEEQLRMIPLAIFDVLTNDKQLTGKSHFLYLHEFQKTKTKRSHSNDFKFQQPTV